MFSHLKFWTRNSYITITQQFKGLRKWLQNQAIDLISKLIRSNKLLDRTSHDAVWIKRSVCQSSIINLVV